MDVELRVNAVAALEAALLDLLLGQAALNVCPVCELLGPGKAARCRHRVGLSVY